jgi:hypothetical protein
LRQVIHPTTSTTFSHRSAARVTVDFDFGWRWQRGSNTTCPPDAFPLNYTGQQCTGLTLSGAALNAADCAAACCGSLACDIWQFCPNTTCGSGGGCWIGSITTCNRNPSWVSYARNASTSVPPEAESTFDDSSWEVIDLPHDSIITEEYVNESSLTGQAYLPKVVSWYRKHFALPANWSGSYIELYIEGAFSSSQWFVNGQFVRTHASGYTSFTVRLDNVSGLAFGGADNVLAAYVDPTTFTGWWYEGGGLYRHISISSTSALFLEADGVFAPAVLIGPFTANGDGTPGDGLSVDTALVSPQASVVNVGATPIAAKVTWSLMSANNSLVASATNSTPALSASNGSFVLQGPLLTIASGQVWSVPRPYLYTLVTTVEAVGGDGTVLDNATTSLGLRDVQFTSDAGLVLNEQVRIEPQAVTPTQNKSRVSHTLTRSHLLARALTACS